MSSKMPYSVISSSYSWFLLLHTHSLPLQFYSPIQLQQLVDVHVKIIDHEIFPYTNIVYVVHPHIPHKAWYPSSSATNHFTHGAPPAHGTQP